MDNKKAPSLEQKRYVASVCPEYSPNNGNFVNSAGMGEGSCDMCLHWNDGACVIFDEVLTGIDQT